MGGLVRWWRWRLLLPGHPMVLVPWVVGRTGGRERAVHVGAWVEAVAGGLVLVLGLIDGYDLSIALLFRFVDFAVTAVADVVVAAASAPALAAVESCSILQLQSRSVVRSHRNYSVALASAADAAADRATSVFDFAETGHYRDHRCRTVHDVAAPAARTAAVDHNKAHCHTFQLEF